MEKKLTSFELIDPPSAGELVPDPWLDPWMYVVLSLMVMGSVAYILFKKKKQAVVDPLARRRSAYEEASLALKNIESADVRSAAVQTSLILRKYLSLAAADPALFETHEETVLRPEALTEFTAAARADATRSFTRLASLKYSPTICEVTVCDVVTESRALLETLHHGFQT